MASDVQPGEETWTSSSESVPSASNLEGKDLAPIATNSTVVQVDWQTTRSKLCDRGRHMLESGLWSDCSFEVGLTGNIKVFKCHRMILAMASPVFEAMFFGGLAENKDVIHILDVQPEAFQVMLEYIYTDDINLNNFELVCDVCYAAKKYILPTLVEECTKYLWRDLYPRNACRAYEFSKLFEEPILMDKSLQIIRTQTREVLSESTFEDIEHETLCVVLSQDTAEVEEDELFKAILKWSTKECERRGMEVSVNNRRIVLGSALFLIRFLTFTADDFAKGPAQTGLLTQEESFSILMNIAAPGSTQLPKHVCPKAEGRRRESMLSLDALDVSTKHFCKRAMMQEPHCLNTSILDCSVTFTVDKDICIHGIEVPSQVTDIPDNSSPDFPVIPVGQSEYNELLYAHLLDADGNRMTYTHFTAKVAWNSMIEITFNRSVYIGANKVYRIGMVLNKVGWYPMGVCTRRVNCDSCFFTFCVGQPNDTLRDGLIRSIIYSV